LMADGKLKSPELEFRFIMGILVDQLAHIY
jgi:hypothetical protein